jgi:anti-sigma regulatory factor (Ser/Thr protein kinase)
MIRQPIPSDLEELHAGRETTCRWLSESGWPDESLGDVSLVVTELVTNAAIHGKTPAELQADLIGDAVRIEVRDAEPNAPAINPQPSWAGGYGLRIVERVARRWGWEPLPDGKVVWAEVPRTSTAPVSSPRSQ